MITVSDWLNRAQTSLTDSESPRADAELLLMHVLDVNRAWLYTWPEKSLTESQQDSLNKLLARRIEGIHSASYGCQGVLVLTAQSCTFDTYPKAGY